MSLKILLLSIFAIIAILITTTIYLTKTKRIIKNNRCLIIFISSFASLLCLIEIVLLVLLPTPENIVQKFSYLFVIDDLTNIWITIWLSIISIFVSLVTALVAIYISIKQDDIVKFEFETSLVPLLQSNGFNCRFISKFEATKLGHLKNRIPECTEESQSHSGFFIFDFNLQNEININIKYEIESLKVYQGLKTIDETENKNDTNLIHTFDCNDKCLFLDIKQHKDSLVFENQIFIKGMQNYPKELNKFLTVMESSINKQNASMYSMLYTINLKSLSTKYSFNKQLVLLVNLINENAYQSIFDRDNTFTIHSVEHKFR